MADRVKQLLRLRSKGLPSAPPPLLAPAPSVPAPVAAGVQVPTQISALGMIIPALFYLSSFLFILFLILTFVNFTVYPIFKLSPYDQGVLAVYTQDTLQTGWTDKPGVNAATLTTPKSTDYTLSLDIFIPSDYSTAKEPRVILYRGDSAVTLPANTTVASLASLISSNIMIYAKNDTNDIIVAVQTNKGVQTISTIKNVIMGTPIRLTYVYEPTYMEVYMNGKLIVTKAISGTPLESLGKFWPPTDTPGNAIKVGHLQYWGRALMANEIQSLLPLTSTTFFVKPT